MHEAVAGKLWQTGTDGLTKKSISLFHSSFLWHRKTRHKILNPVNLLLGVLVAVEFEGASVFYRYRLVCTGVPPPKVCPCGDLTGSGRDLAWFSGV